MENRRYLLVPVKVDAQMLIISIVYTCRPKNTPLLANSPVGTNCISPESLRYSTCVVFVCVWMTRKVTWKIPFVYWPAFVPTTG